MDEYDFTPDEKGETNECFICYSDGAFAKQLKGAKLCPECWARDDERKKR